MAMPQGQSIPAELWGKWEVASILATTTIACWDDSRAKALLGTEIEYSENQFRWKDVVTPRPTAVKEIVTARQFHDYNSGQGRDSSQVTFRQLGIDANEAAQISIEHRPADITGSTIEIPGDKVLQKDKNTIVFSVCGVYFEARRAPAK
jgi:hypothetical protein